jgi:hypothetical protein
VRHRHRAGPRPVCTTRAAPTFTEWWRRRRRLGSPRRCAPVPVSHSCACIGSLCLRNCVHGASIGGRSGTRCEIPPACSSSPCLHNGLCSSSFDAAGRPEYTCACGQAGGWGGAVCELRPGCATHDSQSQPCQHGANCTNKLDRQGNPAYECSCVGGWSGPNCSAPACASSPCQHDGKCEVTALLLCTVSSCANGAQ